MQHEQLRLGGGHRGGESPLDGPDGAVESELADDGEVLDLLRRELAGGDEHADGDRQIEVAGLLAKIGRGQVDDDATGRPIEAEIGEGPLDAVDAFLHGGFGEADENRLGHAGGRIDFDLDRHGVDADEREGTDLGEHGAGRPGNWKSVQYGAGLDELQANPGQLNAAHSINLFIRGSSRLAIDCHSVRIQSKSILPGLAARRFSMSS